VKTDRPADPSLADCVRWLLHQDYPGYEVFVVIDSELDPACELLWPLLAGPLTQVVYLAALVSVNYLRRVNWRGITYELGGPTPVRLTANHPYHPEPAADRAASVV
jgi:hypothetical protein